MSHSWHRYRPDEHEPPFLHDKRHCGVKVDGQRCGALPFDDAHRTLNQIEFGASTIHEFRRAIDYDAMSVERCSDCGLGRDTLGTRHVDTRRFGSFSSNRPPRDSTHDPYFEFTVHSSTNVNDFWFNVFVRAFGQAAPEVQRLMRGTPEYAAECKRLYRIAAKKHHPDTGGSIAQMKAVNDAMEQSDLERLRRLAGEA